MILVRNKYRRCRQKLWLFLGFGLLGILLSTACLGQSLNIYEAKKPLGIDPLTGKGPVWERFASLYSSSLFELWTPREYGATGYNAILADSHWVTNSFGLTIGIRSDAYFYRFIEDEMRGKRKKDSVKVTAADVIATYKAITNNSSVLRSTRFADQLNKYVESIQKMSDDTIRVIYKEGMYAKLSPLTFPVVPKSAIIKGVINPYPPAGSALADYIQKPWGSGPFTLHHIKDRVGKAWVFKRNTADEGNKYETLTINIIDRLHMGPKLHNGPDDDDDCFPALPFGLIHDIHADYRTQKLTYPNIEEIAFNTKNKLLADWRVRAALSVYIDRETLLYNLNGEANIINGPIPYGYDAFYCRACEIPYYSYNPALGDSLLEAAGWVKNIDTNMWMKGVKKLKIEILGITGTDNSYVAELISSIAKGWKSFGVFAKSKTVSPGEHDEAIRYGKFDAAYVAIAYGLYPELDRYFSAHGKENYSRYRDLKVDSLWNSFKDVAPTEVEGVWHRLHLRIAYTVPAAFLWTPQKYAVYSRWINVGTSFLPHNFIRLVERWKYN